MPRHHRGGWLLVAMFAAATAGCSSAGHSTSADAKSSHSRPASHSAEAAPSPTPAPPTTTAPTTAAPTTTPATTAAPTPAKPLPGACRYLTKDQVASVSEPFADDGTTLTVDAKQDTLSGRASCDYTVYQSSTDGGIVHDAKVANMVTYARFPGAYTFGHSTHAQRSVSVGNGARWDGSTLQVRDHGRLDYIVVLGSGTDAQRLAAAKQLFEDAEG